MKFENDYFKKLFQTFVRLRRGAAGTSLSVCTSFVDRACEGGKNILRGIDDVLRQLFYTPVVNKILILGQRLKHAPNVLCVAFLITWWSAYHSSAHIEHRHAATITMKLWIMVPLSRKWFQWPRDWWSWMRRLWCCCRLLHIVLHIEQRYRHVVWRWVTRLVPPVWC